MRWRHRHFGPGQGASVTGEACGESCDSLHYLRSGARAEVRTIAAGRKARCRLASLGLIQGSILQVIANPGIGPLLLSVGDSRLMVERGIAAKVLVQAV